MTDFIGLEFAWSVSSTPRLVLRNSSMLQSARRVSLMRACVRAYVRACVHACVRACMHAVAYIGLHLYLDLRFL